MAQISNIVNGWKNLFFKDDKIELIAEQRAKICVNCKYAKQNKLLIFVNDDIQEVQGYECTKCKCPLSAKLRSENEKCPLKLW